MAYKNRNRENPIFANINLLGNCNLDCYWCLGKDLPDLLNGQNQLNLHYLDWPKFQYFLDVCKDARINRLYLTGFNTDPLLYEFLELLIDHLQDVGFSVGMRTNGLLALPKKQAILACQDEIGYSLISLNPQTHWKITGTTQIPNWRKIIPIHPNTRVSIVINRYNRDELLELIEYASKFPNVKYIQLRKVATDTRLEELELDMGIFEHLYEVAERDCKRRDDFYLAQRFLINGKEICFWRTVGTSVNSFNYFTDGKISTNYFVVEGYQEQVSNKPS